ncbi:MAG: AraC family transcriptional regulator [Pseudomonadota bacterium]
MDILPFDLAVRGAATGLCILMIALVFLGRVTWESAFAFTAVAGGAMLNMWVKVAPIIGLPDAVLPYLKMLNASSAFAMTWFTLTIFLDNRRHSWIWLASGFAIWCAIILTQTYPFIIPFLRGYAALHFIALLGLIGYSAKGDLLNARRRVRPMMSAFLIIYCVGQAITAQPMRDIRTAELATWQPATFVIFLMVFAIWSLRMNKDNWPGRTVQRVTTEPTPQQKSQRQSVLINRIQTKMADGIWREEGLTVGSLARVVDAPEHQVRRAINQELGFRNFASFINGSRIEAAQNQLMSLDMVSKTVLEIAYDVGFSSLGPFNRAFREATGMSPTDFRKQASTGLAA